MRVWGMGSCFRDTGEKIHDFTGNGVAAIGWEKEDAPALYNIVKEMKKGDIIYIKSFVIKYRELRIKAIGKVQSNILKRRACVEDKYGFDVEWLKTPEDNLPTISLAPEDTRFNIYSCTLYPEYNKKISDKIKELINYNE